MNCLIDLDGTILNVWDRLYSIFNDSVIAGHIKFKQTISKFEYILMKREGMSEKMILDLVGATGVENYLKWRMSVIESEYYLSLDTLFDLKKLEKFNKIILITYRKERGNLINQLKNLEIYEIFDEIITPENSMSAMDFKFNAMKKYKDSTAIGDTDTDILSAKKNGIRSIGVLSGLTNHIRMQHLNPWKIIENISEL